jgi:hypothetical protein
LVVDAVDCEELDLPFIDEISHRLYHAEVFIFVKPSSLAWENDHGFTGMTVDLQFHILGKVFTPRFVVFDVHPAFSQASF